MKKMKGFFGGLAIVVALAVIALVYFGYMAINWTV